MKTLLRSTIICNPGEDLSEFLRNYNQLNVSSLEFEVPEDNVIFGYIKDFVSGFNHVPSIKTLTDHFNLHKQDTVVKRLGTLSSITPVIKGDFTTRIREKGEERQTRQVAELFKDASVIAASGMEIRNGKDVTVLKGAASALKHVLDKSHDIMRPTLGSKMSGEVTRDGDDFRKEYLQVAANPLSGVGQHTGIDQIDVALNGAKRYELWIHAAFTGGMKSTTMLNWAYNQAVFYKFSSIIFSLEMPYTQCRRILYALHSGHEKFSAIRYKLGLQRTPAVDTVGLPYEAIRDGKLKEYHANAERFLLDYVIPDFNGILVPELADAVNPNTGEVFHHPKLYGKIHIEVPDPDKSDFSMADLRQRAELVYSQNPFEVIFIDHVGLMSPRKWVNSTTERLNEIIRDAKRMAMSFQRGQGIPVVALFQLSREGYRSALKAKESGKANGHYYNLTHLSYANEAERSADIVTTSWLDPDLSKENKVLYQNLKSRDQKPFEPLYARIEWSNRRLITCYEAFANTQQKEEIAAALENLTLDG